MKHILVVDDDLTTLDICADYLGHAGHKVTTASTTSQAYECLEKERVDLLVLDVYIPGEGGLDFLQRVRDRWHDLPTILITGYPGVNTLVSALRLNVCEYLPKPFRPRDLLAAIEKNLAGDDGDIST